MRQGFPDFLFTSSNAMTLLVITHSPTNGTILLLSPTLSLLWTLDWGTQRVDAFEQRLLNPQLPAHATGGSRNFTTGTKIIHSYPALHTLILLTTEPHIYPPTPSLQPSSLNTPNTSIYSIPVHYWVPASYRPLCLRAVAIRMLPTAPAFVEIRLKREADVKSLQTLVNCCWHPEENT